MPLSEEVEQDEVEEVVQNEQIARKQKQRVQGKLWFRRGGTCAVHVQSDQANSLCVSAAE